MKTGETAKNYRDIYGAYPFSRKLRLFLRDRAVWALSCFFKVDASREWIRFPFYHHVFDDERTDFERHLKYFKNYGDFISLDQAVDIFEKKEKIDGQYFCVSFDDGFKNCVTNALPILLEHKCQAAFFISTDYIGCQAETDDKIIENFFIGSKDAYPLTIEFLSWDDCRQLRDNGMIIGSHTCSHVPLINLANDILEQELLRSKKKIEKELGIDCLHFCCPWGRPGKDFRIEMDTRVAKQIGYSSFLSSGRGPNYTQTDPFMIKRDHLLAFWGNYQPRYFFSKE